MLIATHSESSDGGDDGDSQEHEDGDYGGDCEDVTMEGGSHHSLVGDRVLRGRRGVVMPHV